MEIKSSIRDGGIKYPAEAACCNVNWLSQTGVKKGRFVRGWQERKKGVLEWERWNWNRMGGPLIRYPQILRHEFATSRFPTAMEYLRERGVLPTPYGKRTLAKTNMSRGSFVQWYYAYLHKKCAYITLLSSCLYFRSPHLPPPPPTSLWLY